MMVCGELWLPGYPVALNFQSDWKAANWANYVANSMTVGDANWLKILAAVKEVGLYLSFGFSELDGNHAYMGQALIGPDGTLIYKRRKVRPSGGERAYWSDAPMAGNLSAVTTTLGRISMLECWDHLRPQSTFNIMAQLPNVHICAWPYIPANTDSTQWWERAEVAHTGAAYFSQLTGAYTLLAGVGHVGVYRHSRKLAELTADATDSMLFFTITPDNWSGATGSTTSEFSYGVLQLLSNSYPGEKVADAEHGTLTMNPLS
jgi:aliphatic nitrilase